MSKRTTCRTCGKECVGREQCRACYTNPEQKKLAQKSRKKEYIVYCLYTDVEGVFYIGCGSNRLRLNTTINECKNKYAAKCMKCRYIHECQKRRIAIHACEICKCSNKQIAQELEYALIQMYPYVLTNSALNWRPMKQLPAFLGGSQEESEASALPQERLEDTGSDLLNKGAEEVSYEDIKLAVDTIIASNDAASERRRRWYINEKVVCDLLGGQTSRERRYLVRKYLALRYDEIAAHHQRHHLTQEDNRKPLSSIEERMKVEPPVSYEPYVKRFQRAIDAILAYNDAMSSHLLQWYISPEVVYDLLGGQSSGVEYALVRRYLTSRYEELEAHHQKHGLTLGHNHKRRRITEQVKVEPAVAYEPYTERCRRAVDAVMVHNGAVSERSQRWYISPAVVYALLGGQSSGVGQYLVKDYLTSRRHELEAHHQQYGLVPSHNRKPERVTLQVKVEPAVAYEPYTERCRRAVDAMIIHNNAMPLSVFRWYICTFAVYHLLGGHSSGISSSLVEHYLASRRHELEAHHQQYHLTYHENYSYDRFIDITECVKVEPAVVYEPYRERFQRATNAIIAYNEAVSSPSLRWYICEDVVYDLLGGPSSGVSKHLVTNYLASRCHELEAHHQQYGLARRYNGKLMCITDLVKIEPRR